MKRMMTATALSAAILAVAPSANAQDFSLSPTFGSTNLAAGFAPDPHSVQLQAGGGQDAASLGGACVGAVAEAPDYSVFYTSGGFELTFRVTSQADTTLVVNTPNTNWRCDDDTVGYDPAVTIQNPADGRYDVWVGTYSHGGGLPQATLHVSELGPDAGGQLSAQAGGGASGGGTSGGGTSSGGSAGAGGSTGGKTPGQQDDDQSAGEAIGDAVGEILDEALEN